MILFFRFISFFLSLYCPHSSTTTLTDYYNLFCFIYITDFLYFFFLLCFIVINFINICEIFSFSFVPTPMITDGLTFAIFHIYGINVIPFHFISFLFTFLFYSITIILFFFSFLGKSFFFSDHFIHFGILCVCRIGKAVYLYKSLKLILLL